MPDINQIIPTKSIESVVTTDKAIIKLDESTIKFVKTVESLSAVLKKGGVSFKEVQTAQKAVNTQSKENAKLVKQQDAAEKSLEKQRQKGLQAMQKQIQKEKDLQAAINKEVKSEQDLIAKTNALVAVRRRLDTTTDKGKAKHASLTKEIDKNTIALKKSDKQIGRNQRDVGNYGKALEKLKGSFLLVAAGAAAFIGAMAGIISKIKESIDKYDVQILAETSLKTALGKTSKALLNQASAFQTLTRFGDEEIIQGQSFLAQMGLTEAQILQITPAILDFAQAKGVALKTAADLVAKSIGSETNALSRYGIQIEGAAGSQERLESALDALNVKFKGQAEAALVGKGALVQLGNTIGDVLERVGKYVTEGINPMIQGLNELLTLRDKESDSLITEQGELNTLVTMITNANISQSVRNGLIEDLQEEYPNFLKNLDAEKVTNEQLALRLGDVNDQYKVKIAQVILDEKLVSVNEDLAESYRDELNQLELIAEQEQNNNAYSESNIGRLENNIGLIKVRRGEIEKEREEIIKETKAFFNLTGGTDDFFKVIVTGNGKVDGLTGTIGGLNKQLSELQEARLKLNTADGVALRQNARQILALQQLIKEYGKLEESIAGVEGARGGGAISTDTPGDIGTTPSFGADSLEGFEGAGPGGVEPMTDEDKIAAAQSTMLALDAIANTFFQAEMSRINALQAANAQQKAYELKMAEGNQEEINKINEKFAKKEAKLKTDKAKADKKAAIFNASINIAQAILTMIAGTGGPAGFITAALAAAIGAVQLSAIIAEPIPKFYKGTENAPGGPLWAGDRGRELIDKDGKMMLVNEPTMLSGLQGAKIYTNQETEKILATGNVGFDSPDLRGVIESNNRIEKAIINQKHISIDRANRTITMRSGNYAKKYINAKLTGF